MEFNTTQTKLEIFLTSCNSFHVVSMLNILQHFNFYRAMLRGKMPCVCVSVYSVCPSHGVESANDILRLCSHCASPPF